MITNGVYEFCFTSCMNIIFIELRQQRAKYTHHFLSHVIFIANLSAILIGSIL